MNGRIDDTPLSVHQSVAVSSGTGEGDFDRISAILEAVPQLRYICVDVANGYSEHFVHFVKEVRQKFQTHTIMVSRFLFDTFLNDSVVGKKEQMLNNIFYYYFYFAQAGNVVTGEMVEELLLAGADIIKVGIGPGDHSFLHTFPRQEGTLLFRYLDQMLI